MQKTIEAIKPAFEEAFEDFILSRKERRSLKDQLASIKLDDRRKQVLWHFAKQLTENAGVEINRDTAISWLYEVGKLLQRDNDKNETSSQVYFSPGTACQAAICSAIRFASKDIDICVFTISDDVIASELLNAHRLGKNIRIITDNDKTEDRGSDINRLAEAGIKIVEDRTDAHMHHKFALFDKDKLLTGSYNWTRSAATENLENILITEEREAINAFQQEFDRLWKRLYS
jgi:cardiolipin hydrolase